MQLDLKIEKEQYNTIINKFINVISKGVVAGVEVHLKGKPIWRLVYNISLGIKRLRSNQLITFFRQGPQKYSNTT